MNKDALRQLSEDLEYRQSTANNDLDRRVHLSDFQRLIDILLEDVGKEQEQ